MEGTASVSCLQKKSLQRQTHFKNGPVAEACKCQNHISPEKQDVGLLRKFHISQDDEKSGLQKEKQGHFLQIPGKSHESNNERKKTQDTKHAVQENIPLL